jgi:hypothetical protein
VKEAKEWLDELIAKHPYGAAYQIAEVYAWWGDKDSAFQWLDRSYVVHDPGLAFLKPDPLLRRLHPDSRYNALLRKMKLLE